LKRFEGACPSYAEDTLLIGPAKDLRWRGPQRARALLERFGSIAAVAVADVTALASVPNIGYSAARAIRDALGAEPTTTRVSGA
jgi:ERCC4-type nuclease